MVNTPHGILYFWDGYPLGGCDRTDTFICLTLLVGQLAPFDYIKRLEELSFCHK